MPVFDMDGAAMVVVRDRTPDNRTRRRRSSRRAASVSLVAPVLDDRGPDASRSRCRPARCRQYACLTVTDGNETRILYGHKPRAGLCPWPRPSGSTTRPFDRTGQICRSKSTKEEVKSLKKSTPTAKIMPSAPTCDSCGPVMIGWMSLKKNRNVMDRYFAGVEVFGAISR